ncbi:sulfur carrier protein ThiS [Candidatus Cyanaurora vandensis]|uniref:sulfur carrier protein ThiS n=1 Tax=Candidatus Cyanaurora vandensis TaxID=2714958 RepID=UPI00257B23B3|nr:sulfur carrier protein ThiS [Candidatus Cyanaurora vandensis]
MLTLTVNGQPCTVPTLSTVCDLLNQLQLAHQLVVIEYNGDILHRQDWERTLVQEQDRFEIVTVVGGG